jgi:hypothetical protein
MEPLDASDAPVPRPQAEPGRDSFRFAPDILKVLAIEFWFSVDDLVFRTYWLSGNDSILGRSHLFGRWPTLEHGASHGSP